MNLTSSKQELETKRDEALALAVKIKKALQTATESGADQAKIDEINEDLTKALVAAGEFQRLIDQYSVDPAIQNAEKNNQETTAQTSETASATTATNVTNVTNNENKAQDDTESQALRSYQEQYQYKDNNDETTKLVRQSNPLNAQNPTSLMSSFTYQLTLYIATPEAMSMFLENPIGIKLEDGYWIVAQSGGIGSKERRAITNSGELGPGSGLDFFIEDLNFEMFMPGSDRSPSAGTIVTFKIIEPTGFTFLTKMAQVVDKLSKKSKMIEDSEYKPNLYQQHYMLGIRFYGYDKHGNITSPSTLGIARNKENAITDSYALFERFFPIVIGKATYKLDGKATVYNIEATSQNLQTAFGAKRGTVKQNTAVVARTVHEALSAGAGEKSTNTSRSLVQILTEQQELEKDSKRIDGPTIYNFEWSKDAEPIKNSRLTTATDPDPKASPMSNSVTNTAESNVKQALSAVTYTTEKRRIEIAAGTPILSVIDNIISKSEYVVERLKSNSTTLLESKTQASEPVDLLDWFTVNPIVKPLRIDSKTKDWVYEITYQIQAYHIPYLRSLYKGVTKKYYGPHKKYYFIFSGNNSEIISYEQEYDNQFYLIRAATTTSEKGNLDTNASAPVAMQGGTSGRQDLGKSNRGSQIAAQVQADLYSPADLAKATIKILGDPDYLMTNISGAPKFTSDYFRKLYGSDGYSINPYGGQIFIEIVFYVATDYNKDGLMNVSDSVKFYTTSPEIARSLGIEGIVYKVNKVRHMFARGQFTQELELFIVPETQLGFPNKDKDQQREQTQTSEARSSTQQTSTEQTNNSQVDSSKPRQSTQGAERSNDDNQMQNEVYLLLNRKPASVTEEGRELDRPDLNRIPFSP